MAAASIIASVITGGSNSHQTVAEELNAYATDFVTQGIVGAFTVGSGSTAGTGSFAVTQDSSPDMGVTVLLGQAYVSGTPSGQDAQVIRARMTSNYTSYTINANASGSTKYDWIYLQLSATNANNPSSAADNVITLVTSRSSSNSSDNGSPPTYGLLLAVVTVANGASSITNANITDKRLQVTIGATSNANTTGWNNLGYALTYSANNGNKEFQTTTPVDLTGILSPGMRLKVSRSVTPPTQCAAFTAASSQYATKASPTGITFTSAFTYEAWIYLNSYTQGIIGGRIDSTSANGSQLYVNSSGQLVVNYASAGNGTNLQSYQSLPLKRWIHVAGVVSSVASKTMALYINGASVPGSSTVSAATALTQAGNLTVGANGIGGTPANFFDGYIAEFRIWSAAQTQAQIQDNMAISLVGIESNLVFLGQFNGNFNDATSNANNLTATNGAIATQAANPYNATEYAIITKVSYSNPTTTVTLFTGTDYTIPNQTLNTPYYSTSKTPYGFPAARNKWIVDCLMLADTNNVSVPALNTVQSLNYALSVPVGAWRFGWSGIIGENITSGTAMTFRVFLNTIAAVNGGILSARANVNGLVSGTLSLDLSWQKEMPLTLAADTTYTAYGYFEAGGGTITYRNYGSVIATGDTPRIYAECAYI